MMHQEPIDCVTPHQRMKRPLSRTAKWSLLVLGLIVGTAVAFVFLMLIYIRSLGSSWADH